MPKVQTVVAIPGYFESGLSAATVIIAVTPTPEDWTIEAMKFLLCGSLQERFGMNYIIDVLRGSKTRKFFSTGITIFLLMASAKIKVQRIGGCWAIALASRFSRANQRWLCSFEAQWLEVMRRQRSVSIAVTAVHRRSPGR